MKVLELIQELMKVPPESDIITIWYDPEGDDLPTLIGASLYVINPREGMFEIQPRDPLVFIGQDLQHALVMQLLN